MRTLVEIVLSNALVAAGLAVIATVAGRYCRRPQVVYGLWLLVLVKLATPPLVRIPVSIIPAAANDRPSSTVASSGVEQRSISAAVSAEGGSLPLGTSATPAPISELDLTTAVHQDAANVIESECHGASPQFSAAEQHSSDEPGDDLSIAAAKFDAVQPGASPEPQRLVRWGELLFAAWILGATTWLSVVMFRLSRFRREIARHWLVDLELQRLADGLAQRMGLRRAPAVRLVDAVVPPMLCAMCWPAVILLPRSLVARLSPEQQSTLLAHELAHFRRRDHWIRWFELVVIGVYWWHPIAWIARRELARAEEQCCDELVLQTLPGRQCDYARVILETIDFLAADCRPAPLLATGLGPVHRLERRFEMILHARPMHCLPATAKLALLLLGLLVLPLSTRAQVADDRPAEPKIEAQPAEPSVEVQPAVPRIEAQPAVQDVPRIEVAEPKVVDPLAAPNTVAPVVTSVEADPVHFVARNNIEQRLQRLEKLVESIAAEMKNQRIPPTRANNYRAANEYGITGYPTLRATKTRTELTDDWTTKTLSLSELKRRRIDIEDQSEDLEDQLKDLQDKLADIDDRIAKLQSVRPSKRNVTGKLQAK